MFVFLLEKQTDKQPQRKEKLQTKKVDKQSPHPTFLNVKNLIQQIKPAIKLITKNQIRNKKKHFLQKPFMRLFWSRSLFLVSNGYSFMTFGRASIMSCPLPMNWQRVRFTGTS